MASTATLNVLEEVKRERIAQDKKHGGPANDDRNSESDWHRWIIEHLGMSSRDEHAGKRQELIRVAALAVAAVEAFDRIQVFKDGGYVPEGHELGDPIEVIPF